MIKHVAFIMDGNRRWARKWHLPLAAGHTKGYQAIEPLIAYAVKKKIKYVTFWAFSTENWNRDKKEVELLLQIFRRIFQGEIIRRLHKNGVKINILGEIDAFPKDLSDKIKDLVEQTKNNTAITVNIGLNYGGRAEIVHAVNKILALHNSHPGKRSASRISHVTAVRDSGQVMIPHSGTRMTDKLEISEEDFSKYLYTKDQPDPDLIIRTGAEQRLSGFLPWQSIYSELYFPEVFWPDFNEKEFEKAIDEFEKRKRRFGT